MIQRVSHATAICRIILPLLAFPCDYESVCLAYPIVIPNLHLPRPSNEGIGISQPTAQSQPQRRDT
jgi:hypothetical protein